MSAGFTKGPWGYSFVKQDTGFEGDTFMAGPLDCEGGFSSIIEGGLVLADDKENEANARLIAAAPELYEALDCIVRSADQQRVNSMGDLWGMAVDALAKARGAQ